MKFLKAALIWLTILPLAILNGGIRDYVTAPLFGSNIALPLSGIILSALILGMACLLIPKIGKSSVADYILTGVLWVVLTNIFDLSLIFAEGKPLADFLSMFDVRTGNLWALVNISCLISPILAAKIRKLM
jgi:hypothetical protein